MTEEQQKEQFSMAYVRAVAAVAGIKVERPEIDDDSVDLRFSIKSIAGSTVPPIIETQLKCTSETLVKPDGLHFELKLKNYEDLRGDRIVPRFLIVLLVPPAISDWLGQSQDQLVLKKWAYWYSLQDHPDTSNKSSVTVVIPGSQLFTVIALKTLLAQGAIP